MQDVLAVGGGALCKIEIREIPFDELDTSNVIEIASLSCHQ
jgi:hypothetical protein